jgi:hypothetical protein
VLQGGAGVEAAIANSLQSDANIEDMRARTPGGRHNNDHPDYRSIAIVPTPEEVGHVHPILCCNNCHMTMTYAYAKDLGPQFEIFTRSLGHTRHVPAIGPA